MIIGITGGTGCGKTTLLEMIRQQGGLVLDCDAIYHALLKTDKGLIAAIEARFPGTVENGSLQRKRLGAIVFADEKALLDLNTITHSAVKREVEARLNEKPVLAAIDAIGLFEGKLDGLCDVTVAVTAPREARLHRLMARDSIDRAYAEKRIDAQKPESWFREKCDHVLVNDGTYEQFRQKCLAFLHTLGIMKA